MDFNLITNVESCHIDVPTIIYYSHIPTSIIALLIGFFVYSKNKTLISKLLLCVSILFSLWSILSLITWIGFNSSVIMFSWAMDGVVYGLINILMLYFVYVFIEKTDIPYVKKVIPGCLLLPLVILMSTQFNLKDFNSISCEASENFYYTNYYYGLGLAIFLWTMLIIFLKYRKSELEMKKQLFYLGLGVGFFLALLFLAGFAASLVDNYFIEPFGLFGMTFFMGMLAYLIVKFEAFHIRLIEAQALVAVQIILIASQFAFIQNNTNKILTGITLALSIYFGYFLVKSVKKEISLREELEVSNKEIAEKNKELSDRKEQLQQMADFLSISNDKLKRLDQVKTDFINMAAHQLKHAPTPIKGYLSMFLEGSYGSLTEEQMNIIKNINTANERQIHLVNDLLEVARMEASGVQLELKKENIEDICQAVFDNLAINAEKKNLEFKLEKSETPLPELLIDKSKIFECIFNFVDNAIKYTPSGSIVLKSEFSEISNYKKTPDDILAQKPDFVGPVVRITVSDTGNGISPENISKLFAKFARTDTAKSNEDGTGLGLYIVKLMIEAQGGKTWAESEGEGKGSRFVIELKA